MRKVLTHKKMSERPAGRTLLAFSLVASLAAVGCTTNRTPGNGDPLRSSPGIGPSAPTSGLGGSSSGSAATNPPMFSSSVHRDPLPSVTARSRRLPLSPDEAAAVMADNQGSRRGVVLGPVNPGPARGVSADVQTGVYQDPAARGGGIVTVNSSVNSIAHTGGIPMGDAAAGGGVAGGVTAAATIAGATGVIATPTTAAIQVTPGALAAGPGTATVVTPAISAASANTGTLTPTVSSGAVPSPTVSGGALIVGPGAGRRSPGATTAGRTGTTATPSGVRSITSGSVRITQDGGRVVVSNTGGGKSQ